MNKLQVMRLDSILEKRYHVKFLHQTWTGRQRYAIHHEPVLYFFVELIKEDDYWDIGSFSYDEDNDQWVDDIRLLIKNFLNNPGAIVSPLRDGNINSFTEERIQALRDNYSDIIRLLQSYC